MQVRRVAVAATAAVGLVGATVLAGCGSSQSDGGATASAPTSSASPTGIDDQAGATQGAVSPDADWPAAPVWVFGDSTTRRTSGPLESSLESGLHQKVALEAVGSLRAADGVARLQHRMRSGARPKVVVFALGSNDTVVDLRTKKPVGDPNSVATSLKQVRQVLGPSTKVVFVEVYVGRTKVAPDVRAAELANSRLVNSQVAAAKAADATVPWFSVMEKNHATYTDDGVHTNATGTPVRDDAILSAVRRFV